MASELKKIMLDSGAVDAMMSGSGPSVFGIFHSEKDAKLACDKAGNIAKAFVCKPVGELSYERIH